MSVRANIATSQNGGQWAAQNEPWNALFGAGGSAAGIPLGTARWLSPQIAVQKFAYDGSTAGSIWMGGSVSQSSRANDRRSVWARRLGRHFLRRLLALRKSGRDIREILPADCHEQQGATAAFGPSGRAPQCTDRVVASVAKPNLWQQVHTARAFHTDIKRGL